MPRAIPFPIHHPITRPCCTCSSEEHDIEQTKRELNCLEQRVDKLMHEVLRADSEESFASLQNRIQLGIQLVKPLLS